MLSLPVTIVRHFFKAPRFAVAIFHIITIFLLCKRQKIVAVYFCTFLTKGFLILSCTSPGSAYTNAYLIKLVSSPSNSTTTNSTSNYTVLTGFLSICAENDNSLLCAGRGNTTASSQIAGNTDPVDIALLFSNHLVNFYFACISMLLTLLALGCSIWSSVPFTPQKYLSLRIGLLSALAALFIWCIGSVWLHVAVSSTVRVVQQVSSEVKAVEGSRSAGMNWTALVFLILSTCISYLIYRRESSELQLLEETKAPSV